MARNLTTNEPATVAELTATAPAPAETTVPDTDTGTGADTTAPAPVLDTVEPSNAGSESDRKRNAANAHIVEQAKAGFVFIVNGEPMVKLVHKDGKKARPVPLAKLVGITAHGVTRVNNEIDPDVKAQNQIAALIEKGYSLEDLKRFAESMKLK